MHADMGQHGETLEGTHTKRWFGQPGLTWLGLAHVKGAGWQSLTSVTQPGGVSAASKLLPSLALSRPKHEFFNH